MWGHIINIHLNELLSIKTKEPTINESNGQFTFYT